MSKETKKELRYYAPLIMGFFIMCVALFAPPIGVVPASAIYAGGSFLILCATVVGLDVPAALREIRLLRQNVVEEIVREDDTQVD